MSDNCPHAPVDMLHGWKFEGRGRDLEVGGVTVVDHDERPDWDRREWSGGDCDDETREVPTDRTGWPPDGSIWESDNTYHGIVEWSLCGRRWMMYDPDERGFPVDWTAEPIDLTVWRTRG